MKRICFCKYVFCKKAEINRLSYKWRVINGHANLWPDRFLYDKLLLLLHTGAVKRLYFRDGLVCLRYELKVHWSLAMVSHRWSAVSDCGFLSMNLSFSLWSLINWLWSLAVISRRCTLVSVYGLSSIYRGLYL